MKVYPKHVGLSELVQGEKGNEAMDVGACSPKTAERLDEQNRLNPSLLGDSSGPGRPLDIESYAVYVPALPFLPISIWLLIADVSAPVSAPKCTTCT